MYYLNIGEMPSTITAPALKEVRERLKLDGMTKDELAAYYRHLDNIVISIMSIIWKKIGVAVDIILQATGII